MKFEWGREPEKPEVQVMDDIYRIEPPDITRQLKIKQNKVDKIRELAGIEFDTRSIVNNMSTMNAFGLSYEESKQAAIDYAEARYNHFIAERNLYEAIKDVQIDAKGVI